MGSLQLILYDSIQRNPGFLASSPWRAAVPGAATALPELQTWLPCPFAAHVSGRKGSACSLGSLAVLKPHKVWGNPDVEAQLCHNPTQTL